MNNHERKSLTRTALFGAVLVLALHMAAGAVWAQTYPDPLPLDPPMDTEAFIS